MTTFFLIWPSKHETWRMSSRIFQDFLTKRLVVIETAHLVQWQLLICRMWTWLKLVWKVIFGVVRNFFSCRVSGTCASFRAHDSGIKYLLIVPVGSSVLFIARALYSSNNPMQLSNPPFINSSFPHPFLYFLSLPWLLKQQALTKAAYLAIVFPTNGVATWHCFSLSVWISSSAQGLQSVLWYLYLYPKLHVFLVRHLKDLPGGLFITSICFSFLPSSEEVPLRAWSS